MNKSKIEESKDFLVIDDMSKYSDEINDLPVHLNVLGEDINDFNLTKHTSFNHTHSSGN